MSPENLIPPSAIRLTPLPTKALVGKGVSLIADGGIRFSGDIAKAIAAGADSVMMGGLFAGTEEASSVPANRPPIITESAPAAIALAMSPENLIPPSAIRLTPLPTKALVGKGVSLIADGGIRFSGDIAKAIAAGADSVMMGGLFAGTEEAPGEVELFQGRSFKTYRGMGSIGAMTDRKEASNRYLQDDIDPEKLVPEGIEGRVPYKGLVISVINQLIGGVRQSMGYVGCRTINSMKKDSQFIEITNAGMAESHVHDVMITKEAPNYQRG